MTSFVTLKILFCLIFWKQVNKTSTSIRVIPSSRNSTISNIVTHHTSHSETQMLRLLNSAAQKREVKATQNLSIIVAFFMICWIPLYTINCVNAFCKQCFINESVIYFGIILSHLNSAINPLLYAYHLKDFRGAMYRLIACKSNDPESKYRPSLVSQQQMRIASQNTQRRSYQQQLYIDSPVWKRQQRQMALQAIGEAKKQPNDADSGFGKWEKEFSNNSAPSPTHDSPTLRRNHSSQSNKIFIISDSHHTMEPEISCEPQSSSLYRIVNNRQESD